MPQAKRNRAAITILRHVVLWLIFLSIPAIFNPERHSWGITEFARDIIVYPFRWSNALLFIAVFYFNYYVAIPKLYMRQRYGLLVLSVVGWFALFVLVNDIVMPPFLRHRPGFHAFGVSFNLFMFIIVYVSSFMFCIYEQWQRIKVEKLNTEILFLKAQINPHFLFNTLNSIYSLALTRSDRVAEAIVKLSGIMRYTISESNMPHVWLTCEVNYIRNYIELQKLRLTDEIKMSFEVDGDTDGLEIAPFLLIPFVENAFKYGVNAEHECDIRIRISISKDILNLYVSNKKVFIRADRDSGTGIGIETTKKRLDLLYPGKYSLKVTDEADFIVELEIGLK
jgi:hypothetical protein